MLNLSSHCQTVVQGGVLPFITILILEAFEGIK